MAGAVSTPARTEPATDEQLTTLLDRMGGVSGVVVGVVPTVAYVNVNAMAGLVVAAVGVGVGVGLGRAADG